MPAEAAESQPEQFVAGHRATARDVVTERIAQRAAVYPDFDLAPLDTTSLESRDAALAVAIDQAVARRWLTLQAVVTSQLSRPWANVEPRLQAVLLVGAAQLLLLDRLPDHAVINEAVNWAKRRVRPKAGGLVNAVLRKVAALRSEIGPGDAPARRDQLPLSDGRCWNLTSPVFADDPMARLAEQTAHPRQLLARWAAEMGSDRAAEIARHSIVHPPIIVTGVAPDAKGCQAHERDGFFIFEGSHTELTQLLSTSPHSRVQDPVSAVPAELSRQINPRTIIDLCAGRGTKTRQLAAVHPDAQIIATDRDQPRLAALREATQGLPQVEVMPYADALALRSAADLLVLDVPCSNTGVFARRVEAKYRCTPRSISQLAEVQRQIMADAMLIVRPGGHVLYATCSIEREENQAQTEWLMKWHGFSMVDERASWPRGGPGDDAAIYTDGGYAALLCRPKT